MMHLILAAILMPFIIFADLSWKGTSGGQFIVEAHASPEKTFLEKPLEIKLVLTYPLAYSINIDQLTANLLSHPAIELPPFELVSADENKTVLDNNSYSHEIIWILKPKVEGKFFLSFFEIDFTPSKESKLEGVNIISDLFEINVSLPEYLPLSLHASKVLPLSNTFPIEIDPGLYREYVTNDDLEKQEAQRNIQIFHERAFPWIICLLIPLLALFAYLVKLSPLMIGQGLTHRNKREQVLKEIVKLQHSQMPPSLLYEKLDRILREYFQFQYHIEAPTQTTNEFLLELEKHSELNAEMKDNVIQFISNSEMVKFAKKPPTAEECSKAKTTVMLLLK